MTQCGMSNLHRFVQTQLKEHREESSEKGPRIIPDARRRMDRARWASKDILKRFTPIRTNVIIKKVVAGFYHTLFLNDQGQLYSVGSNKFGQLGVADTSDRKAPELVQIDNNGVPIVDMAGGIRFSVAVDSDGSCYSWGWGEYGELGLGLTVTRVQSPKKLENDSDGKPLLKMTNITAGGSHVIAIVTIPGRINGTVYAWGRNDRGQLGISDVEQRNAPEIVNKNSLLWNCGVTEVAASQKGTALVSESGDLWTWGECTKLHFKVEKSFDLSQPRVIESLGKYHSLQVACGQTHCAILTDENQVLVCDHYSLRHGYEKSFVRLEPGIQVKRITSHNSTLYITSKDGRAFLVECDSSALLRQNFIHAPTTLKHLNIGDEDNRFDPNRIDDCLEESKVFDDMIDELVAVELDPSRMGKIPDFMFNYTDDDAGSPVLPIIDRFGHGVEPTLYTGKSIEYDEVADKLYTPLETLKRAKRMAALYDIQCSKSNNAEEAMKKALSEMSIHGADVVEFTDFMEKNGIREVVKYGNNVSADALYDIDAHGRVLEDDNIALEMRRMFYEVDVDGSGSVEDLELFFALEKMGYRVTIEKARRIIKKYSTVGAKSLSLEEFITFLFDFVNKYRKQSQIVKWFSKAPMEANLKPPPRVPPVVPAAKLRRLEQESRIQKQYKAQLKMDARVTEESFARFVNVFMDSCVAMRIWNVCPPVLKKQITIPSSQPLFHIGELDLSDCEVDDKFLKAMCFAMKCVPIIKRIDLRQNKISDVGAKHLVDLMKHHNELAEYVDCAKCMDCGTILDFDNVRDPLTPMVSCFCNPASRGGPAYALPVYFIEHVYMDDPLASSQVVTLSKCKLAIELDAFSTQVLQQSELLAAAITYLDTSHKLESVDGDLEMISGGAAFTKENFENFVSARIKNAQTIATTTYDTLMHETKRKEIRRLFDEADADNSGYLDEDELVECLKLLGFSKSKMEAKKLMDAVDLDKNGQITVEEFEEYVMSLNVDSQFKLLGAKKKKMRMVDENGNKVKRRFGGGRGDNKKEFLETQSKELEKFGKEIYETFLLSRYLEFAKRKLLQCYDAHIAVFVSKCKMWFFDSAPHRESLIQDQIQRFAQEELDGIKREFGYSADEQAWQAANSAFSNLQTHLLEYFTELNSHICIAEISPGQSHAILITKSGVPWIKGIQDCGEDDLVNLWKTKITDGIISLENR